MDKKITIVDKNDNVIGSASKDVAFKDGVIRRISRVFLIDKDQIYLQRRGPNMRLFPDTWGSSAGGHVDEGESYEEAAKRELFEELGIKNIQLIELGKFYLEETYKTTQSFQFSMVFSAIYNNQPFMFQKDEVSGGCWFKFDEVTKMVDSNPQDFATGFVVAWNKFKSKINN